MKIFLISVPTEVQPASQNFNYPKHNKDYGVEQDFYEYLLKNPSLLTSNSSEADWYYLPIFWTRWHLNHSYGKEGLDILQAVCDSLIVNDTKTFTVCQYDDGPLIQIGATILFLASRKSSTGIDIPLLCSLQKKSIFPHKKKYLASFVGRLNTHPIRRGMADRLKDREDVLIYDGDKGQKYFVKTILASKIALSPRGYGGSSFRFFESLSLSIVPFLISDIDTRPFKKFIDWSSISFYTDSLDEMLNILANSEDSDLLEMGKKGSKVLREKLKYGAWCQYVVKELVELK